MATGKPLRQGGAGAGHLAWVRPRWDILALCYKEGAIHSNNNEYSITFGVKMKNFETILISWVCAQLQGEFDIF